MTVSIPLLEEDYLDWIENARRSPAEAIATDALIVAAWLGLGSSAWAAGFWLVVE